LQPVVLNGRVTDMRKRNYSRARHPIVKGSYALERVPAPIHPSSGF